MDVFPDKLQPLRTGRKHIVVAVKAAPLRKMVCQIKRSRRWGGIFVVNETDLSPTAIPIGSTDRFLRFNDDISTQKIAMCENKLFISFVSIRS